MKPKKNPLKLNKLQLRTLALAQVLAQESDYARKDEATGDVTLLQIPEAHGDHLHIGQFTVSTREASGLRNPSVWAALQRKGLVRVEHAHEVILTAEGVTYDAGFGDRFMAPSDH